MWKLTDGNVLEADVEALVNTVNTVGVMGKGIALQFKKAFPEMFNEYARLCKVNALKPGGMHVYDRGPASSPRYIINFPTKRHWKEKSKLEDVASGLDALVETLTANEIRSVAIPPLGCGFGGLDWDDVRPLIEQAMDRVPDVDALIYAPKGAPAPAALVNRTERPEMTPRRAGVLRLLSEYSVFGYELTLLEIQKILYFFQTSGEPLQLRFVRKPYGPYADNLRHVLNRFEGHFLEGFGDGRNSPRTPIRLFDDAVREAVQVSEQSATLEQKNRVHRVFELIEGFESPYGMELLASVHWVAAEEGESDEPGAVVEAVHAWNDRKQRIMKPEHVQVAWRRLRELGWLDQTTTSRDEWSRSS